MDNTDSIIEKIKKAIRLANRTTSEGERDTAMRLARRLADSNGIAFDELANTDTESARAVKETGEPVSNLNGCEVGMICNILRDHFGVIVMFTRTSRRGMAKTTWFGVRINIEIAKHVWHILRRESYKAWYQARVDAVAKERKARAIMMDYGVVAEGDLIPKVKKQDFMRGFFWAINKKLADNPLRNDLDEAKKAAERKFDEYRADNDVKETKKRIRNSDANVVAMGLKSGSAVNLARPCEGVVKERFAITA